jgi:hypothetical protein
MRVHDMTRIHRSAGGAVVEQGQEELGCTAATPIWLNSWPQCNLVLGSGT